MDDKIANERILLFILIAFASCFLVSFKLVLNNIFNFQEKLSASLNITQELSVSIFVRFDVKLKIAL